LSDTPWRRLERARKHRLDTLRPFAQVLFLEPPAPLRPPATRLHRTERLAVGQVAPLLNTRLAWAQAALHLPPVRRVAERAACYQVNRLLSATRWHRRPANRVVIVSSVFLHSAARALRPHRLVVEINTDPRRIAGAPPWTADLLLRSVLEADIVLTPSDQLAHEFRRAGARCVRLLPNDDEVPQHGSEAGRLLAPRSARAVTVGYHGPIGSWLDFSVLDALAARCPELHISLGGPVEPSARPQVQALLNRHPNISTSSTGLSGPTIPLAAVVLPIAAGAADQAEACGAWDHVAAGRSRVIATSAPARPDLLPRVDIGASTEAFIQLVRVRVLRRRGQAASAVVDLVSREFRRSLLAS
jgi:hypothetical protein